MVPSGERAGGWMLMRSWEQEASFQLIHINLLPTKILKCFSDVNKQPQNFNSNLIGTRLILAHIHSNEVELLTSKWWLRNYAAVLLWLHHLVTSWAPWHHPAARKEEENVRKGTPDLFLPHPRSNICHFHSCSESINGKPNYKGGWEI